MKTTANRNLWKFFLGGKEKESPQTLKIHSPYDGKLVGETFLAPLEDLQKGIDFACEGFKKTKNLQGYQRSEILMATRDGIAKQKEEFARLICLEAAKPIKDARREVERSLITFTVAAEEAKRMHGDLLDLSITEASKNRYGIFRQFPIGPILGITPFNFPLNLVAHKLAPAMAVGTSFILKPASQTPLSSLKLAEVILEAGYPPEAVNVLPSDSKNIEALLNDNRIKLISFTGSPSVGWKLKAISGNKKVVLELGGNAGVIIDESADLRLAAQRCATGAFSYAGQSCISVQRIFVRDSVMQRFADLLLAQIQKIKSGDPSDESTDLGPMIDENAAKRASAWIEEAVAQNADLLIGGKRSGKFLEPTVLMNVKPEMKVSCEEVFAPLLTITPFADFKEALNALNDSRYGLQAGIFTNQFDHVLQAYSELEVGGIMVNEIPTWRAESMPYGGIKESGFGREGIRYAMQEMTEGKLLVFSGFQNP